MIRNYINTIKNNRAKLVDLKKSIGRYKLLSEQFGKDIVDEAIQEMKKAKGKESMDNIEVFLAHEKEIEPIVWNKHAYFINGPIKEIETKDIAGLVKKYNTTPEAAKLIVDLKITDLHNAAALAQTIIKYNLKDNPDAVELAYIIFDNELFLYPNTVILAEIYKIFSLKDNPDAIKISHFIMDNNLKDNPNAVNIYNFIISNNLKSNPDAVNIANMVCQYGIPKDLAMEVSQYNHEFYKFKQRDEKYIFHKLRQLYKIKIKTEPNFNFQQEIERIERTIGIDTIKAKYFLICCMGDNWGRNSSIYWNYDKFKDDFADDKRKYTDEEAEIIKGYTNRPDINRFARGFKSINDRSVYYYDNDNFAPRPEYEEIMMKHDYYMTLYKALNKYALDKDIVVFRGAPIVLLKKYNITSNDSEEEIKKKLAGHYQDGGFMSTSVVLEEGGNFMGAEVNFIIDLKAGTPCGELSGNSKYDIEREVLLPPNVSFNVNDVKKIDGKVIIYLTSIPTKSLSYFASNEDEDDDTKSGGRGR